MTSRRLGLRGLRSHVLVRPLALLLGGALVAASCATVQYTGRRQLAITSAADENALGEQLYGSMTRRALVSRDARATEIVEDVGRRIALAAERPDWKWRFTLFHDHDQVNAWALPGGKVGIYTGILPVAKDEAGLAAIVGHEVAHAIARHGAERSSQSTLLGLLGAGLSVAVAGRMGATSQALLEQAYGLGAQLGVILPFSRGQESEADEIGLILMAKAGYDPQAALGVWDRMAKVEKQQAAPPEFLSTHPSYGTRVTRIRSALPAAATYYRPGGTSNRRLPRLAEMEPPGRQEAALLDAVGGLDKLAAGEQGSRALAATLAAEFNKSAKQVVALSEDARLSPGETALTLALSRRTGVGVTDIVRRVERSGRWYEVVRDTRASVQTITADLERIGERTGRRR